MLRYYVLIHLFSVLRFLCITCEDHYTNDCKVSVTDRNYRGHINMTTSGRRSKKWRDCDSHKEQEENYCRTPSGDDYHNPWCYTTDPNQRWEECNVPVCNCSEGRYGENCEEECHCKTPGCDVVNGHCKKNGCADGWTGDGCNKTVKCKEFPHIDNIKRPIEKPDGYSYPDNKTLSCQTGYMIIGIPTLTCGTTGNWSLICISMFVNGTYQNNVITTIFEYRP